MRIAGGGAGAGRRRRVERRGVAVLVPLLVSGRDEAALRAQARRWAAWLAAHPDVAWADVVRTAALHRTHFESWR